MKYGFISYIAFIGICTIIGILGYELIIEGVIEDIERNSTMTGFTLTVYNFLKALLLIGGLVLVIFISRKIIKLIGLDE